MSRFFGAGIVLRKRIGKRVVLGDLVGGQERKEFGFEEVLD